MRCWCTHPEDKHGKAKGVPMCWSCTHGVGAGYFEPRHIFRPIASLKPSQNMVRVAQ